MTLEYNRNGIMVYCGDALEIVAAHPPARGTFLLTDPPYGKAEKANRGARGRSNNKGAGIRGPIPTPMDFAAIAGDDAPFDPRPLLGYPKTVLWGANYYAGLLPVSPSWIVWDKLAGLESKRELGFNDNADLELAWTNLGGPARLIPHRWMGIMKGSEQGQRRVHPTQKPIALSYAILDFWGVEGETIIDPYCGSGSALIAAKRLGLTAIGGDIIPEYVQVTISRLEAE